MIKRQTQMATQEINNFPLHRSFWHFHMTHSCLKMMADFFPPPHFCGDLYYFSTSNKWTKSDRDEKFDNNICKGIKCSLFCLLFPLSISMHNKNLLCRSHATEYKIYAFVKCNQETQCIWVHMFFALYHISYQRRHQHYHLHKTAYILPGQSELRQKSWASHTLQLDWTTLSCAVNHVTDTDQSSGFILHREIQPVCPH